jgi:hypothetical protein
MESWQVLAALICVGLAWVMGREYGTHDGYREGYERAWLDSALRADDDAEA